MRALFFLVLFYGVQAHAGLLLEPYLNYSVGKWTEGSTSQIMQGAELGGRVGYTFLGLQLGVDYMTGNGSDDASPRNSITPSDVGIFVGYQFPLIMRVYAEYIFVSQMNFTAAGTTDTLRGDGFKLGAGYDLLPFLTLNLEYKNGDMTHDSAGRMMGDRRMNLFQIGLSAPFNL